jgi:NAD(P)-dependent dehydrogenase (short-subunit alcohol dehydrogenase family)
MSTQPVVMVTGAARGLGSELVRVFSKNGYQVFATARTIPEKTEDGVIWQQLDVSNFIQCKEVMASGFNRFGHIDVLINNASNYGGSVSIVDMSRDEIDKELRITLQAPIHLSKLYVELARAQQSGKIIFISSVAGLSEEPECAFYSVYAASKAGLIRFAECLHEDIQSFGMQAHVVVPCSMRSGLSESELMSQKAVSYDSVARLVLDIAKSENNTHTKSILRHN